MAKFLIRAGIILVAGVLAYCGLVWLAVGVGAENWLPNFYSTAGGYGQLLLRMREVQETEDVDIVFIGSSHAYRGFDPREFKQAGVTSFNLGSTSQTPFNSYYLLRDYLPALDPELVVMDLYWNMLVQDGLESTIDIVSNAQHKNGVIDMVVDSKNAEAANSLLVNAIQRLHTPLHEVEQVNDQVDVYVPGGFTQTLFKKNTVTKKQLENLAPMEFEFAEVQREYIHKIIRLCKKHDIQLVFVVTPVTHYYRNKLLNYPEYFSAISAIAEKHQIPLIDYNQRKDLELNALKEFYDEDHLTQPGVKKFNKVFINDLQSLGLLNFSHAAAERLLTNN